MTSVLDNESKESYLAAEFIWGDPLNTLRLNTSNSVLFIDDKQFDSLPAMEIDIPAVDSDLEESSLASIEVYILDHVLFDQISQGVIHAPLEITIYEVFLNEEMKSHDGIVFKGKASKTIRNTKGKSGRVRIEVESFKKKLIVPMGISCGSDCAWTFGERGCLKTREFFNKTIVGIEGNVIELNSAVLPEEDEFKILQGQVSYDGLSLSILDVDGVFLVLRQQPPIAWNGNTVEVGTGCDKTIETCRLHDNESQFGGFGFAMLDYNPNYEDSP